MLKATSSIVNVSQITGVLPVVNGGTGVTTSTGTGSTVLSAAPTLSGNVTLSTGNLIVASGQGIDFSATSGTGTSELFDDYEEGTWTPVDGSGAGLVFGGVEATYTKIGNTVRITGQVAYPSNADASSTRMDGLPFIADDNAPLAYMNNGAVAGNTLLILNGTNVIFFFTTSGARPTNANYSNLILNFSGVYYT